MTPVALHLAFCDGAFHFDCPSCTALCCRGAGFAGSLEREVPRLLTLYPSLASLAVARQADIVHFANPASGCYFLDADRLCRIEKEHGRALKPGVCGLFPFNSMLRVGDAAMLRPHFLCPLRAVVPARPGEVEGTHARVAALARHSGLLGARFFETEMTRAVLHPSVDAAATLAREVEFRDRSAQALGTARFVELLRATSPDPGAFADHVRRAAALLGLHTEALEADRDDVDDLLILLAAPLRTTMLRLSGEGIACALAVGGMLFRRAIVLGTIPSLSAGWDVQAKLGPALRLLGRLEEPLVASPGSPPQIPAFTDPALALAATIALRGPPGGTLTTLERALPAKTPPLDRTILITTLGMSLEK